MALIKIKSDFPQTHVGVPKAFIDTYMAEANGEFVKVYLYLLLCMNTGEGDCSISAIADYFNHTEKDVLRALKYWEKVGVLGLDYDSNKKIVGLRFIDIVSPALQMKTEDAVEAVVDEIPYTGVERRKANLKANGNSAVIQEQQEMSPQTSAEIISAVMTQQKMTGEGVEAPQSQPPVSAESKKRSYTLDEKKAFSNNHEVSELIFVIETYLKHPLNATEMDTLFFWYDGLQFSGELIEYLVEYCMTNQHSSMRYMDKVAIGWADNGIDTIEKAKEHVSIRSKAYYSIMKAFGISGRNLADSEVIFVNKWSKEYGFDIEIIQEACKRTISATQKPSFEYADSILTNWHKSGVHTLKDVAALDADFAKSKQSKSTTTHTTVKRNSFNSFNQRKYDSGELEKLLLTTSVQ